MRSLLLFLGSLVATAMLSGGTPVIVDLAGKPVTPLHFATSTPAVMLFFVAPDCPISNRYAPTIARLASTYEAKGVKTWLIYADDQADSALIRTHQSEFKLELPTALDREFTLTKYTNADVTPEVVVYVPGPAPDAPPQLVYRGRIDDQYEGFGRYRPAATSSELTQILDQVLDGTVPAPVITKAIGCYIPQ